jgi:hypothetical protein
MLYRAWTDRGLVRIVHTLFDKFYFVNSMYILTTDSLTPTKDRPVLSSERAPHMDSTASFLQK